MIGRFCKSDINASIQAQHKNRLRLILSNLDQADASDNMDFPGLSLHSYKLIGRIFGQ